VPLAETVLKKDDSAWFNISSLLLHSYYWKELEIKNIRKSPLRSKYKLIQPVLTTPSSENHMSMYYNAQC